MKIVLSTPAELEGLAGLSGNPNTERTTRWAKNTYRSWARAHHHIAPEDNVAVELKDLTNLHVKCVLELCSNYCCRLWTQVSLLDFVAPV